VAWSLWVVERREAWQIFLRSPRRSPDSYRDRSLPRGRQAREDVIASEMKCSVAISCCSCVQFD